MGPLAADNGQVEGHNGGYERPHELPCSLICFEYHTRPRIERRHSVEARRYAGRFRLLARTCICAEAQQGVGTLVSTV